MKKELKQISKNIGLFLVMSFGLPIIIGIELYKWVRG